MNLRLLATLLLFAPLACSPAKQAERPPLEGAKLGGDFALIDQDGRRVTQAAFAGKYRIMYFGYTFCPDVCPVDMQNIGAAMKLLEKDDAALAQKIVPVFVTIDPARDTPAVVNQFVRAFHPRMVGLTGTPAQIAAVAKEYAVYYAKGTGTPDGYMMDHSRQAYLMDPNGKPLALLPQDGTPEVIVAEIKRWAT